MPAFVVAAVVSAVLLFAPSAPSDGPFPSSDKVVHLLVFGTLACTGRRARLAALPLVAGLIGYAVASELIQGLEPGRSSDPVDVLADLAGIAAGLLLLAGVRRSAGRGS